MRAPRTWVTLSSLLLLPLGALWSAHEAHADTATDLYVAKNGLRVCAVLDAFPTTDGILGIADALVQQNGFDYYQAGQIEATAVYTFCPRHLGLLQQFIDGGVSTPTRGAVGGPYRA